MLAVLDHDWRGRPLDGPCPRVEMTRLGHEVRIVVDAPFWGDRAPAGPAGRWWELWQHEVVELFIAGPGARYIELELGPHGHHLFLRFAGVRQLEDAALPLLYYQVALGDARWRGEAAFDAAQLPPGPLRCNVCAIRGEPPREHRSLVALPGAVPDFHQPDEFLPCDAALSAASG